MYFWFSKFPTPASGIRDRGPALWRSASRGAGLKEPLKGGEFGGCIWCILLRFWKCVLRIAGVRLGT